MYKMELKIITLFLLIFSGCNSSPEPDKLNDKKVNEWVMSGYVKVDSINPILTPSSDQIFLCPVSKKEVNWEERNVLNPSAIIKDGKVYMIYRPQDNDMTSRLGLAINEDGLHFKKDPSPVLYPADDNMQQYEWDGGVEDPRIIEGEDGTYIMTYTSYDGETARLCLASSKDLRNWTKHRLVFRRRKVSGLLVKIRSYCI